MQIEPSFMQIEPIGGKAKKRLNSANIISVFGAVEQKPSWDLGTEQMYKIFQTATLI